jgi:hypothetical protein
MAPIMPIRPAKNENKSKPSPPFRHPLSTSIKLICCLILCCALGYSALYPKDLLLKGITWGAKRYCKRAFDANLVCQEVVWEDGCICLKQGKLEREGELNVTFHQASLRPFFHLIGRSFGGNLKIDTLKIIHSKKKLRPVPSPPSPSFKLFILKLDTIIENGELLLNDYLSKDDFVHHSFFSLDHHVLGEKTSGTISFHLKSQIPELITHFSNDQKGEVCLSTHFQQQPLNILSRLITYFFRNYLPDTICKWEVSSGLLDGDLDLILIEGVPLKMHGSLNINSAQGTNTSLSLLAALDQFDCDLDIDFSQVSSINGQFDLKGGRVALQEKGPFWEGVWDLKNVHSHICVKEGKIESSAFKGSLMGMEGEMVLDWRADDILMKIGFRGSSSKMLTLLPESLQKSFYSAFPKDDFFLDASLRRSQEGLELKGNLSIIDEKAQKYQLPFECLLASEKTADIEITLLEKLDFSFSRSVDSFLKTLQAQFCLSKKRLGWMSGKNLPLEKFVSPFLLADIPMKLSGCSDIKILFDEQYAIVLYEGKNFCLDSSFFNLQAPLIGHSSNKDTKAIHYFDLKTGEHAGFLPLHGAKYYQKNFGFLLENIETLISFENEKIHIQQIEAEAAGLHMKGNVDLAIQALDAIDLKITLDQVNGPVSCAQAFLSHFKPSYFWQMPFDGQVSGKEQTAFFHYHFSPTASLIEGRIQGDLSLSLSNPLFALQNYHASIFCDFKDNLLQIKEGRGELAPNQTPNSSNNLGIKTPGSNLTFCTPSMVFRNFSDFLIDCSCIVLDNEEPILTLEATSEITEAGKAIHLKGNAATIGPIYLEAIQQGSCFKVQEFACGLWQGHADIFLDEKHIALQHCECAASDKKGFSFGATYDLDSKSFNGTIQSICWNLGTFFEESLSPWKPSGSVIGSGNFCWKIGEEIKATVTFDFEDMRFGDIYFGSGENLKCTYVSSKGISVEGLEVEIPSGEGLEKYKLGRFHYNLQTKRISFEGFDFSLPPEKLPWMAKWVNAICLGKLQPSLLSWVAGLKQAEPLEGKVSLEIDPASFRLFLNLKDGEYFFGEKKFFLKNFHASYDPRECHIWSDLHLRDQAYSLHFLSDSMTLRFGKLRISQGDSTLTVCWEKETGKPLLIKSAVGQLTGMDISLTSREKVFFPACSLEGSVALDIKKVEPLFEPFVKNFLERFKIAGHLTFEGVFTMSTFSLADLSFAGMLSGTDVQVKGLALDTLTAHLLYTKQKVVLSDVAVKDWAGRLFANHLTLIHYEQKGWQFFLDQLKLVDLRFSRLKSQWTKWTPRNKPFYRSLYIPSFVLENVSGMLSDPKTFSGSGKVEFTNLPKKTLFSNLLFIPTEITARIGLDLTALIPVRGTIMYRIREGKIYLDEFKEMYSDGKRSRFYLADGTEAFIDFSGNLNLKIKMKQYNLLMKLAEFFTISVKGTLLRPSYTFSNHLDAEDSL